MKKLIFTFIFVFLLAMPIMAENITQQQAREKAEKLFDIKGYSNFEISNNDNYSVIAYDMLWSDDKGEEIASATIRSDGSVVYYSCNNKHSTSDNENKFSIEEGKILADGFIKKIWGEEASNIRLLRGNPYSYEYIYSFAKNGIENVSDNILIKVSEYDNEVYFYRCDDGCLYNTYTAFDTSNYDKAKEFIKNGMNLGYSAIYNSNTGKYNVKLLYAFDNYQIRAEDFSSLYSGYDFFKYYDNCSESDPNKIVPRDYIAIEKPKGAISPKKALKIYNNFYGADCSLDDIPIGYGAVYGREDDYLIYINDMIIDSEGRILQLSSYWSEDIKPIEECELFDKNLNEKEFAEEIIKRMNRNKYDLTEIKCVKSEYAGNLYYCNIIRNGLVSFNEGIYVIGDVEGDFYDLYAQYADDDAFDVNLKAEISKDEAFNKAVNDMELKPYYYNEYTGSSKISNRIIKIYGFRNKFSINAVNGFYYDNYLKLINTDVFPKRYDTGVFEGIVKSMINTPSNLRG